MKYILVFLGGLLIGAILIFYFFVGAPRARSLAAGTPLKPPDQGGPAPGTAIVTLNEQFFDTLLSTVFKDLQAPSLKLSLKRDEANDGSSVEFVQASLQGGCESVVVVQAEGNGVKTGVRFINNKVTAPLAFSGSYNVFGRCWQFKGTAQANVDLLYNQEKQTLYGQINVETVNLEGVTPVVIPLITSFVQSAINQRVNPLEILRVSQLALSVPVQASNGTLKAQVKDVRSEIKDNALHIYVTYDFSGVRGQLY